VDLAELSLAALRERCADPQRVRPRLLALLALDPRAGARELGARVAASRARHALELARLRQLYALEGRLRREGHARVAGVDEVGMGPLAGPVVAAAVVLPPQPRLPGLRDSKQLSAAQREELAARIRECARGVALGSATREEIDSLNIYRAGLLAMRRALEALAPRADFAVLDARTVPEFGAAQRALPRADQRVACVSAASIVAKVARDALMQELDAQYPGYGFARNAGYSTAEHLSALRRLGPSPAHRRSFEPVAAALPGARAAARPGALFPDLTAE
jgi:ribonuclease HII